MRYLLLTIVLSLLIGNQVSYAEQKKYDEIELISRIDAKLIHIQNCEKKVYSQKYINFRKHNQEIRSQIIDEIAWLIIYIAENTEGGEAVEKCFTEVLFQIGEEKFHHAITFEHIAKKFRNDLATGNLQSNEASLPYYYQSIRGHIQIAKSVIYEKNK